MHTFKQHNELLAVIMLLAPSGLQGQSCLNSTQSGQHRNYPSPVLYIYIDLNLYMKQTWSHVWHFIPPVTDQPVYKPGVPNECFLPRSNPLEDLE